MKLFRIIFVTSLFVVITVIAAQNGDSVVWQTIAVIASALVGATTSSAYEYISAHGQGFKIWWQANVTHRNKDIYLSFAYYYKIEIEGKYLLVRGNRMKDRYQPVGGVYKFYPEARPFLESIQYHPDTMVGNNDETDDLRISIKGKYLILFIEWFLKMENREYGPEREFYEELISPGLIPEEEFRHLRYRKTGVHNVGITKSIVSGRPDEVIYADIFEVSLNDNQKKIIKEAAENYPSEIYLATPEEMKSRCGKKSIAMNLGNNVPWLLGEK